MKATFDGNDDYNGSSATKTITISKAASTVHITWSNSTYDGTTNPASATVSGVAADGDLLPHPSFLYYSGSDSSGTALAGAPKGAGSLPVTLPIYGNDDYNGDSATKTITINAANATVNLTWADPQTYNGSAHPASATVTGPVTADNPITTPAVSFAYYSGSNTSGERPVGKEWTIREKPAEGKI